MVKKSLEPSKLRVRIPPGPPFHAALKTDCLGFEELQHGAQFDVTTGRKQTEPSLGGKIPDMDKLPQSFLSMIEHSPKIMAGIKTYDQRTYEISVDGKSIKLKME
jgi:hypothetical protein